MSIYAELIDIDEMFNTQQRDPIFANHYHPDSEADREEINQLIMTQYGSDFLEMEPSCDCRRTKGGDYEDIVCQHCGKPVVPVTQRPLEPSVWLALPKGVKAFINPKVYTILSNELTISKFNILEHLVNPMAPAPETKHPTVGKYMRLQIPRGINHFVDHFDEIIALLLKENILSKDNVDKQGHLGAVRALMAFIQKYRDRLFCHYLPLPTRLMMITEQTVTTIFASSNIFKAVDAARTIASAEASPHLPIKNLQAKVMKANALMAEYNEQCFHEFFDQKDGWFRQHTFGTRSHFTFRAVINSNTDPHKYWELHLPWSLSVMVFRDHLASKLLNGSPAAGEPWSLRECQALMDENTLRYNPILDDLFKELIVEAPGNRIAVLFNRNPSLLRGSMQLLYVTKVKPDVEVRSISLSVLTLRSLNADFDGDSDHMSPMGEIPCEITSLIAGNSSTAQRADPKHYSSGGQSAAKPPPGGRFIDYRNHRTLAMAGAIREGSRVHPSGWKWEATIIARTVRGGIHDNGRRYSQVCRVTCSSGLQPDTRVAFRERY